MAKMYNLTEVAFALGCSTQTVNTYYKFKVENPDDALSAMIPDFVRDGKCRTRYWTEESVEQLLIFRANLPKGKNGLLGRVTQRYVKDSTKWNVPEEQRMTPAGDGYIGTVETILLKNHVDEEVIEQVKELLKEEMVWRITRKVS